MTPRDDRLLQRFTIADRKATLRQLSGRFATAAGKSLFERSIVHCLRKKKTCLHMSTLQEVTLTQEHRFLHQSRVDGSAPALDT